MFGFVTINDNDLSDSERERYRSVYCGVCRALKRRFGQLPRFALNKACIWSRSIREMLPRPCSHALHWRGYRPQTHSYPAFNTFENARDGYERSSFQLSSML